MNKVKIKIYNSSFTPEKLYECGCKVSFIGGEGIVRSSSFKDGAWKYIVEMPQGLEPTFGRAGAETMVLLNEEELRAARSKFAAIDRNYSCYDRRDNLD
jgi:hypothetical protein